MSEPLRAWYSAKEAPRGGTNFWRLKSGGEVEACVVQPLPGPEWSDKEDLGVVVSFLRHSQEGAGAGFIKFRGQGAAFGLAIRCEQIKKAHVAYEKGQRSEETES